MEASSQAGVAAGAIYATAFLESEIVFELSSDFTQEDADAFHARCFGECRGTANCRAVFFQFDTISMVQDCRGLLSTGGFNPTNLTTESWLLGM
jgi:hypothetical protein